MVITLIMYLPSAIVKAELVNHINLSPFKQCTIFQILSKIHNNQINPLFISSEAGNDNNHAHPDTSMKLGRNVHWHELLEFFSLANQNWSNFKMAALKSKMAATINVKS